MSQTTFLIGYGDERSSGRGIYQVHVEPNKISVSLVFACQEKPGGLIQLDNQLFLSFQGNDQAGIYRFDLNKPAPFQEPERFVLPFFITAWSRGLTPKTLLGSSFYDGVDVLLNVEEIPVITQSVSHAYRTRSEDKLKINNGVLLKNADRKIVNLNVLDQVMDIVRNGERKKPQSLLESTIDTQDELSFSDEELCRELKEAFESTSAEITSDITDDLVEAVSQFAQANYLYTSGGTLLKSISPDDSSDVLQILKTNENMYVFPGDLLNHCETLKILERLSNKGLTDRALRALPGTKSTGERVPNV